MAFGASRHCYTAPCKTYADGAQDNWIRWYRVPDDRPFYEGPTVFVPRLDDAFEATGLEYEKTGINPNPRKHYSGTDVWFRPGTHVDGDEQDFLGEAPRAKHWINGEEPDEPCHIAEHGTAGLRVGARVHDLPRDIIPLKLAFGVGLLSEPDTVATPGLMFGCYLSDISPIPDHVVAGLAFAGLVVDVGPEVLTPGLMFGALVELDDVEDVIDGALEIGAKVYEPVAIAKAVGLELGVVVTDVSPLEEMAGLMIGAYVVEGEVASSVSLWLGALQLSASGSVGTTGSGGGEAAPSVSLLLGALQLSASGSVGTTGSGGGGEAGPSVSLLLGALQLSASGSVGSGGGASSGSGAGGGISNTCCGNVPATLYATLTSGSCAGSFTLVFDGVDTWNSVGAIGTCGSISAAIAIKCNGPAFGVFVWSIYVNGSISSTILIQTSCEPLILGSGNINELATSCGCSSPASLTVTE